VPDAQAQDLRSKRPKTCEQLPSGERRETVPPFWHPLTAGTLLPAVTNLPLLHQRVDVSHTQTVSLLSRSTARRAASLPRSATGLAIPYLPLGG
jgi:hypothetical protein